MHSLAPPGGWKGKKSLLKKFDKNWVMFQFAGSERKWKKESLKGEVEKKKASVSSNTSRAASLQWKSCSNFPASVAHTS